MGKESKSRPKRTRIPRFTRSEVRQMEQLLLEGKENLLDQNFCLKLTEEFNCASGRSGSKAISMKQVQRWFYSRDKNHATEIRSSPSTSEEWLNVPDSSLTTDTPGTCSNMIKEELVIVPDDSLTTDAPGTPSDMAKGQKIPETLELEFEARSSKDLAWYDVATFLAHRVPSSGEPEVRVRFRDFDSEEDEWVNVKKAVRERSIPLESGECRLVKVGDLVLCFRETSNLALYFDAHVVDIQRKIHDIRGCRCLFLIRYDHDGTEEMVNLKRLCRRPSYRPV